MALVRAPDRHLRRRVLETTATGQTRYSELASQVTAPPDVLDDVLMQLARDGKVSLIVVGDSLSVRSHVDPDR